MRKARLIALVWLLSHCSLESVSLVYSMKIRRAFNIGAFIEHEGKTLWTAVTALPIYYQRDRLITDGRLNVDIKEKRSAVGSLFNLRLIASRHWWFECTTGIEYERAKTRIMNPRVQGSSLCDSAGKAGVDDIVFSLGHNFLFSDASQFVMYIISGLPTNLKVSLDDIYDPFIGTRLFNIGAGVEFSHNFLSGLRQSFIMVTQARFIHFFKRHWSPILLPGEKIQPGNITDLFFIAQYRHKKNIFEMGYNPTFFTNQALLLKSGVARGENVVRNSFYASYTHVFVQLPKVKVPFLLGSGFNISRANRFDSKTFTWWLNMTAIF